MGASGAGRRGPRVLLWVGLLVAWLLLAQAGATTWAVGRALRAGGAVQAAALAVTDWAAPQPAELATLACALARLSDTLRWLRRTCWWASWVARWQALPPVHAAGVLLSDGIAAGQDLTELAWWTLLEIESGAPGAWEPLPERGVSASVVRSLSRERGRLLSIRERLGRVEETLAGLGDSRLGDLQKWAALGRLVADLGLLAPHLAGDGPRTVLIVFQNDDELRPTGGFVSSLAELTLRDGAVIDMRFMDSYAVEAHHTAHPPAPAALARWMDAGMLLFRDANWSPDFRESAEVMAALYAMDMSREVDAVVAVNASLAGELLGALGPVALEGYDVMVTGENVREVAATFWAQPLDAPGIDAQGQAWRDWLAHRKDIGAALVSAMMDELGRAESRQLLALATVLDDAIARKDLLVWALADEGLQQDLAHAGLDGRIRLSDGDYLMVVEANVGWNKVNRHVSREMVYTVDLGSEPRAELTITFDNASPPVEACEHEARYGDSYEAMTQGCYWNYVRVLAPAGAVLEQSDGLASEVKVGREAGKTVFGGLVLVPAGETCTVRWAYRLPDGVAQRDARGFWRYDLAVQKQPGVRDVSLTVIVHARGMPVGERSMWDTRPDGSWAAHLVLDRDAVLSLALKP